MYREILLLLLLFVTLYIVITFNKQDPFEKLQFIGWLKREDLTNETTCNNNNILYYYLFFHTLNQTFIISPQHNKEKLQTLENNVHITHDNIVLLQQTKYKIVLNK